MYLRLDGRGAKVIDGWASIEAAAQSGRAFCVAPADDLLVCDGDTDETAEHLVELASAIREARGLPVIIRSGGNGNRHHVFGRIPDRREREQLSAIARALGFDVRHGGARIRPPLSPHPGGGRSAVVEPTDPSEALAARRDG
jgi:hypothetical protein